MQRLSRIRGAGALLLLLLVAHHGAAELVDTTARRRDEAMLDDTTEFGLGEAGEAALRRADDAVAADASVAERAKAEASAEHTKQLEPNFPASDMRQIAAARTTPIAQAFNGSLQAITQAGKAEAMVLEYKEATRQQAAAKDVARVEGNNATKKYANNYNPLLKARQKRLYHMRQMATNASLTAYREKWNQKVAENRMAHAAACKNLTAHNPYPKNSSQYKMVAIACRDEDRKNLKNSTVNAPGSHDYVYGPHAAKPLTNSSEVADITAALEKQTPKEQTTAIQDKNELQMMDERI